MFLYPGFTFSFVNFPLLIPSQTIDFVYTIIPSISLLFLIFLYFIVDHNLNDFLRGPVSGEKSNSPADEICRRFTFAEIRAATHNFSDGFVIGKGGFGKVFKGIIDNGATTVAIKRLDPMSRQGHKEFSTEIEMLSKFRHSHVVSLIGYCDNNDEMILVYEYVENGSLADHLYKEKVINSNGCYMSWVKRVKICIGAARGMDYLHTGTGVLHRVIHRDVKSSNILLDENWAAKISDFGLSKIGPANQSCTNVSTCVKGTPGYCDPEYFLTRRLTRKSDVYSFGVVLFEVLCGRPVFDYRLPEEQRSLVAWAQHCIQVDKIHSLIDPNLKWEIFEKSLKAFVKIAGECLDSRPKKRPTMSEVVASLEVALRLQEKNDSSVLDEYNFDFGETYDNQEAVGTSTTVQSDIVYMDSSSSTGQFVPFSTFKGLLHGNLDIWVYEAKNLSNMDMFRKTSDLYVSISVRHAVIGRTYVISNTENPIWMQHFSVPVAHYVPEVDFYVMDSRGLRSQVIGTVALPVEQICSGGKLEGFFLIINPYEKPCKLGAVLSLSIQYRPIESLSIYHHGVGADPHYYGVPATYFPLRKGGMVTLYQDAHVPDGSLPNLLLDNRMQYVHGKCWRDIFDAVRNARRFVYITGWSLWHKVRLIRDSTYNTMACTLGDLLKSKSQEGVRVLLLLWEDPTSINIMGSNIDGIMQTHGEETRRFFKNSSVQVLLCPRVAGKQHSWVRRWKLEPIYTHHQETVIVDVDAGHNRRRIVAFVGGLGLCNGRYDTPEHPIFRTLQTVHADDFYNPTYERNLAESPREPWHDLHCKIDGPAAYDVLTNFEERWLKASKSQDDDALLRMERLPDIVGVADAPCLSEDDPEGWHIQIFRSIDSNSVKGFPKDPRDATNKNLVFGKNVLIDMSIHTAYVKAIRAAQHFIYIESQYFLGSSYNWSKCKDLGANNLIPMEIALKIAEKIRSHERFAVYIVIPMCPDGNPTGDAVQRILFWQHKTMQMMYETIYKALVEFGLEDEFSPQDYLNFYCLGNREAVNLNESPITEAPGKANTPQAQSQKSQRFMINVHSKGMIVDDEYVIIGSANINQRSMEGTRDTEIAIGAYQPHHTWASQQRSPHGQIYGYRMSLWAEHLGLIDDCFMEPESLECVRRVRSMGEVHWKQFEGADITEMKGHLLKYPVEVDLKGKVRSLPGCETFPDVGGQIVGSFEFERT